MFLWSSAEATLNLTLPLGAADMVNMRNTGRWKASQSFKKSKLHLHDEPNPIVRVHCRAPSPEHLQLNPGLAPSLILRKGFSDYISTIVLGFPELRKQWEHQTKEDPIEQSCPSPAMGFSRSISLCITHFREMTKFPLQRSFQNTKQTSSTHFFGLGKMKQKWCSCF